LTERRLNAAEVTSITGLNLRYPNTTLPEWPC
jgi:hypothetical protein